MLHGVKCTPLSATAIETSVASDETQISTYLVKISLVQGLEQHKICENPRISSYGRSAAKTMTDSSESAAELPAPHAA